MAPDTKRVAYGVDLGGSTIHAGVVDASWSVRWRASIPTPACEGPHVVLDHVVQLVTRANEALGLSREQVAGIGVGLPGLVDADQGLTHMAANLPGWEGFRAADHLRVRLGMECRVDHDVRVATRGEMLSGAGRGLGNVVLATIGTGIGVCLVIDGKIYDRSTGDMGHMTIDPDGRPCSCGSVGCLERYVSGSALQEEIGQALRDGRLDRAITPVELADMARTGQGWARDIFDRAGRYLGFGMLNVIAIVNPEAFIIGGGLAGAWDLLVEPAIAVLEQHAFMFPNARQRVRPARLGDDAGIIGAASLILGPGEPGD